MSAEVAVVQSPFGDWWVVARRGETIARFATRAEANTYRTELESAA